MLESKIEAMCLRFTKILHSNICILSMAAQYEQKQNEQPQSVEHPSGEIASTFASSALEGTVQASAASQLRIYYMFR